MLDQFLLGLGYALSPVNLAYSLLGCLLGTLIGVLPGIGPLATMGMLLPLTINLEPLTALIMLAGIFYGAQYGGSTTAILVNLPGEPTSAVTAIDGYRMAKAGRGGAALTTAALASFLAGCIAAILVALFAPPLAELAVHFNAPEYFALMMLGLVACVAFTPGSPLNALGATCLGMLLGLVGSDVETGTLRFTLGVPELSDGLGLVAVVMGLFGLAEIVRNLSEDSRTVALRNVGRQWLTRGELKAAWPAALRGTTLGSVLGILPGGGVVLAPFASYLVEKRLAQDPSRFGQGAIEGVSGPEAANNAAAQTSLIPLLTLGIPANAVAALMLGALIIQGIQPGPDVMAKRPELFWGVIASMLVANAMLLVINLPLIGLWTRLLSVPYRHLFPAITVFCCVGTFTVSGTPVDVYVLAAATVAAVVLTWLGYQPVPLLLGLILGPLAEEYLRRAMFIARGDLLVFVQRPISAMILLVTIALVVSVALPNLRRVRRLASD